MKWNKSKDTFQHVEGITHRFVAKQSCVRHMTLTIALFPGVLSMFQICTTECYNFIKKDIWLVEFLCIL